jgi:hypothetical protein
MSAWYILAICEVTLGFFAGWCFRGVWSAYCIRKQQAAQRERFQKMMASTPGGRRLPLQRVQ